MSIFRIKILKLQKAKNQVFSESTILVLNHCQKPVCDVHLQNESRREKANIKVSVFSRFHCDASDLDIYLFQGSPGRRGLAGHKGPIGKRVRDDIFQ